MDFRSMKTTRTIDRNFMKLYMKDTLNFNRNINNATKKCRPRNYRYLVETVIKKHLKCVVGEKSEFSFSNCSIPSPVFSLSTTKRNTTTNLLSVYNNCNEYLERLSLNDSIQNLSQINPISRNLTDEFQPQLISSFINCKHPSQLVNDSSLSTIGVSLQIKNYKLFSKSLKFNQSLPERNFKLKEAHIKSILHFKLKNCAIAKSLTKKPLKNQKFKFTDQCICCYFFSAEIIEQYYLNTCEQFLPQTERASLAIVENVTTGISNSTQCISNRLNTADKTFMNLCNFKLVQHSFSYNYLQNHFVNTDLSLTSDYVSSTSSKSNSNLDPDVNVESLNSIFEDFIKF